MLHLSTRQAEVDDGSAAGSETGYLIIDIRIREV